MTVLLVFLTVFEIVLVIGVLAVYVTLITSRLRSISLYLAKIAFGVRAVDTQTAAIGPAAGRVNSGLRRIESLLGKETAAGEKGG
ncbi:MAG: hypothetical protein KY393_00935 [Actinobacteria bacterium]|nr:hypothetical protein [Actinomycetota bacterium]